MELEAPQDRAPEAPPLLEVRGLTVRRGGQVLLDDVALAVAPGALHVVVGPNGGGKTTLFSAILGLTEFEGTIRLHFRGQRRIGYVPQRFGIDRTLPITVGEFLALSRTRWPVCLGLGRRTRAKEDELLERVGLRGFGKRPLGMLSGGELQRVLLANAVDPAPELLLLDEPASGLDETAVRGFEELLFSLRAASSLTLLLVSHDLGQVRRIADTVTVLNRTVRATGTPAAVLGGDLAASLLGPLQ